MFLKECLFNCTSMKLLLFSIIFFQLSLVTNGQEGTKRKGKLFALFNLVHFKNEACTSSFALPSGGRRSGTCFTSMECMQRGGRPLGGCASGFGVCCVFVVSQSGSNVLQNCTYIQNPGFPSMYADDEAVSYTITRCSSDVCFLRLDFESFTLLGTGATVDGAECQDQFQVMVASGQRIPIICGENSGQHIYIDLGEGTTDSAMLQLDFFDESNKHWDIKVTQYRCGSENAPDNGCLQYLTGLTGRIQTFNYDLVNDNHLPNQEYSICVRQEDGYCCVQYQLCADELATAFTLSTFKFALQDINCKKQDFIRISGSSSSCSQTNGGQLTDKYCGNKFSDIFGATKSTSICDCTPPFTVGIFTNLEKETVMDNSKGLCLDYTQIPCTG